MSAVRIDKGWLSGAAGSFVQLNSVTALRVERSRMPEEGYDVDALVEGQWITIAIFREEGAAHERVDAILKELKHLFRYGN
jgi:hypothetical protein